MKRKIALALVLCMMVALCIISNPMAYAEEWKVPEGTQIYKPGRTMALDFGTFTILDVGFAKKAQSIIQVSTRTTTVNGVSHTTENRHVGYYTAKDGRALFAFKGLLYNSSNQPITLESLNPIICFNEGEPTIMYGYPAVPFGIPEYYTLEPNMDVEIVFACTAPNSMYYGNGDILLEFAGGTLGFQRADVGNYNSIGFTTEDGKDAGDLTEVPAIQEEGVIVANQPHVDEVRGEDVSLEFDERRGEYRIHVKIRNLTGYPLIREKLPQRVSVSVQFLDSNGDVLPGGNVSAGNPPDGSLANLAVGQAGWDNSYDFVSKSVIDKAEWVRFSSYSFDYGAINRDGSAAHVNGSFSDPLVIALSDILPEKKLASQGFTVADIDAALQGSWTVDGTIENSFHFANGKFNALVEGITEINGTYEINLAESSVDVVFRRSDGNVSLHLPFVFDNGELTLMNNENKPFTKN